MAIKISLRFTYESKQKFDIESLQKEFPFCRICQNIKGSSLFKDNSFIVKENNLTVSEIVKRGDPYNEDEIKNCIREIFKYIDKNDIELKKEFCISFVSDTDQFGLNISNDLVNFLSKYNFSIRISGVFV